MAEETFESSDEFKQLEKDLDYRITMEVGWQVGRYVRRIRDDAKARARELLKERGYAGVDAAELKRIADEAIGEASHGMFLDIALDYGAIER